MNANINGLFAQRIKNERKRLGLTQAQAAENCGVSRQIWGRYETGQAMPNSELLFVFQSIGMDIHYLFSGVQIGRTVAELRERGAMLGDGYRQLTENLAPSTRSEDERQLLLAYRDADEREKMFIQRAAGVDVAIDAPLAIDVADDEDDLAMITMRYEGDGGIQVGINHGELSIDRTKARRKSKSAAFSTGARRKKKTD